MSSLIIIVISRKVLKLFEDNIESAKEEANGSFNGFNDPKTHLFNLDLCYNRQKEVVEFWIQLLYFFHIKYCVITKEYYCFFCSFVTLCMSCFDCQCLFHC